MWFRCDRPCGPSPSPASPLTRRRSRASVRFPQFPFICVSPSRSNIRPDRSSGVMRAGARIARIQDKNKAKKLVCKSFRYVVSNARASYAPSHTTGYAGMRSFFFAARLARNGTPHGSGGRSLRTSPEPRTGERQSLAGRGRRKGRPGEDVLRLPDHPQQGGARCGRP